MGYLIGFAPWIVYWILVGNTGFIHAVAIALGIAIAGPIVQRMRGGHLHTLDVGTVIVFAVLLVIASVMSDDVLERWLQPLSNGGLFLISLAGIALGRPFVREYALEQVDADTAATDGFRVITVAMTWMWTAAFGVMTLSALIPPIVDGDATIRDEGHLLSVICYWVIPYAVLGVAGLVSGIFPSWFEKRSAAVSAREAPALEFREQPAVPPDLSDERVTLRVPVRSRHDEPFPVVVAGCAKNSTVRVRASGYDLFGRTWHSAALFVAREDGVADLAELVPESGDWSVADTDGPLWSMRVEQGDQPPDMFIAPMGDWNVTVEAVCEGTTVRRSVQRRAADESVIVTSADVDGRPGLLALPGEEVPANGWPAVVCFGGSEGGFDEHRQTISMLASRGFAALSYSWLDEGASVARVPVERFAAAVNWLSERSDVDPGRIGALGISRGAEGLLAAAANTTLAVHGLVLLSPSAVSWQAIGDEGEIPETPSWTLYGDDLPFAPLPTGALMPQLILNAWHVDRDVAARRPSLLRLHPAYAEGLKHAPHEAFLPSENVRCPILCITGGDDAVWPSTRMAETLLARRGDVAREHHIQFPGAGHVFRFGRFPTDSLWTSGIAFGGDRQLHAAAEREATEHVFRFLAEVPATDRQ